VTESGAKGSYIHRNIYAASHTHTYRGTHIHTYCHAGMRGEGACAHRQTYRHAYKGRRVGGDAYNRTYIQAGRHMHTIRGYRQSTHKHTYMVAVTHTLTQT